MPSPQGTITDRNLELVLRIGSKVIKTDIKQNTFLSNFWKCTVFRNVSRLRPFGLLVTATCRYIWVWVIGGMMTGEKPKYLEKKLVTVSLCPPQIPLGLIWDRSWASVVRIRQLSASMAWPTTTNLHHLRRLKINFTGFLWESDSRVTSIKH